MYQDDTVYEYLRQNFSDNEPIILSEIEIAGMKDAAVRQEIKKLISDGRLKQFDAGIYFSPKKSIFRSGLMPSIDEIIRRKYLLNRSEQCGYISGILFANLLGITTQVPSVYEIYTNKTAAEYQETTIAGLPIILRSPCVPVTSENAATLQFLDLLKEIPDIAELSGIELTSRLFKYMRDKMINPESIRAYLPYYPECVYKNMCELGLLSSVST